MRHPAKVYPIAINAASTFVLQATGTFLKVQSASGTFRLSGDTFGDVGEILAGQGFRLEQPFTRLTFTDTSGNGNTLSVLVAGDEFVDNRIAGDVGSIDARYQRTLAREAFTYHLDVSGAATFISVAQLKSVYSNVAMYVNAIRVSVPTTDVLVLGWGNSGAVLGGAVVNAAVSKHLGNGLSYAQGRTDNATFAAGATPTGHTRIAAVYCLAANDRQFVLTEPILLTGGNVLSVWTGLANNTLRVQFDYFEKPYP